MICPIVLKYSPGGEGRGGASPLPQILSSMNDYNELINPKPEKTKKQHDSTNMLQCFFTILRKSENDPMVDTHIRYKVPAENKGK